MSDETIFTIACIITILLCLWIGWYTLIVVLLFAVITAVWMYVDSSKKDEYLKKNNIYHKRMTLGDVFLYSAINSIIGTIIVVMGMLFRGCVNDDGPSYERIERRTKIHTRTKAHGLNLGMLLYAQMIYGKNEGVSK